MATVSRVINGSDLISPRTREHVQAVIHRLGYRPRALARRILGHSQMVCFVLANRPFHSFHAGVLKGTETCASELNHHVVFLRVDVEKNSPLARSATHSRKRRASPHRLRTVIGESPRKPLIHPAYSLQIFC